jgi:hypothetical protein
MRILKIEKTLSNTFTYKIDKSTRCFQTHGIKNGENIVKQPNKPAIWQKIDKCDGQTQTWHEVVA